MTQHEEWTRAVDDIATGEQLSSEDARRASEHAAVCPSARAESDFYETLAGARNWPVGEDDVTHVQRRVLSHLDAKSDYPRSRRTKVAFWSLAAMVVAVFLALGTNWWQTPANIPGARDGRSEPGALTLLSGSVVRADADHALVVVGQPLLAATDACIRVDAGQRVCLAQDSRVTITKLVDRNEVVLESGVAVAELDPLPSGMTFEVVTSEGTVQAIGTVFSVETFDAGTGRVSVHQGAVSARARDEEIRLQAGEALRLSTVELQSKYSVSEVIQRRDFKLLGRSAELPQSVQGDAGTDPKKPPEPARERPPPPTAIELLEKAQRLRVEGRAHAALAAYRALRRAYPASQEGHVALMPIGELELSLGDPHAAFAAFDAYAKSGGPLIQEASYGRIRALRRLGNSAAEHREVTAYLAAYPDSVQAKKLRLRLEELEKNPP